MKLFKLLPFLLSCTIAVQAQHIKFSDEKPEAGKTVSFLYDPKGTPLADSANIKCEVHRLSTNTNLFTPVISKVNLKKEGTLYTGTVLTADSTSLIALTFYTAKTKDNNPSGYYVKLSKRGVLPAESYTNEADLLYRYGPVHFGMKPDLQKSLIAYQHAFELKPGLKDKYLYNFLEINYKLNPTVGIVLIQQTIDRIRATSSPREKDLRMVVNLYQLLNNKSAVDSAIQIAIQKYPTGANAYTQDLTAILAEKSGDKFEAKLIKIISKYNLDEKKKADSIDLSMLYGKITKLYRIERNNEKFEFYVKKNQNTVLRAELFDSYASDAAESEENTVFATKLSKISLDLLIVARDEETPLRFEVRKAYLEDLDKIYALHADTYAHLLYQAGKYRESLKYEELAMSGLISPTSEMYERYINYLTVDSQLEKAYSIAEKAILNGNATDSIKKQHEILFSKLGKKEDYSNYIGKLNSKAGFSEEQVLRENMINIPAPAFSLLNLKGERVTLADLKGKVVIIDYWATWCIPCIGSFPSMQKVVNHFKDNPNVVFLFINTSQREDNREKTVKDFMRKLPYTFNVLLDTQDKADPNKFDIANAYKVEYIPAKFIIDGSGNIRFKMVGTSGSADNLIKEMETMIGLASEKDNAQTK